LQLQGAEDKLVASISKGKLEAEWLKPKELALLEMVKVWTQHAYKTTSEDIEGLRAAGWTEPQIAEAVYITALFAFFNRVADAFGLQDPGYLQMKV
jgi:alkylhydroperoxidase family enzyme